MHASRLLFGLQKQTSTHHLHIVLVPRSQIGGLLWIRRTDCSELNDSMRILFSDRQNQSPVPGTPCPQTHRGAPHLPALDPLERLVTCPQTYRLVCRPVRDPPHLTLPESAERLASAGQNTASGEHVQACALAASRLLLILLKATHSPRTGGTLVGGTPVDGREPRRRLSGKVGHTVLWSPLSQKLHQVQLPNLNRWPDASDVSGTQPRDTDNSKKTFVRHTRHRVQEHTPAFHRAETKWISRYVSSAWGALNNVTSSSA